MPIIHSYWSKPPKLEGDLFLVVVPFSFFLAALVACRGEGEKKFFPMIANLEPVNSLRARVEQRWMVRCGMGLGDRRAKEQLDAG
jgi:hypothetical protein